MTYTTTLYKGRACPRQETFRCNISYLVILNDFLIEQTQLIDTHVNSHSKGDLFVCMTVMITLTRLDGEKLKEGLGRKVDHIYCTVNTHTVTEETWNRQFDIESEAVMKRKRVNDGQQITRSLLIGLVGRVIEADFCSVEKHTEWCQHIQCQTKVWIYESHNL